MNLSESNGLQVLHTLPIPRSPTGAKEIRLRHSRCNGSPWWANSTKSSRPVAVGSDRHLQGAWDRVEGSLTSLGVGWPMPLFKSALV